MDNRGNRLNLYHKKGEQVIKKHALDDIQFDSLP